MKQPRGVGAGHGWANDTAGAAPGRASLTGKLAPGRVGDGGGVNGSRELELDDGARAMPADELSRWTAAAFGDFAQMPVQCQRDERAPSLDLEPVTDRGLPRDLRAGIEHLSNLDMSDVVVHRNSPRPAALGALAVAQGSEIHLGPGQDHHLPHEAWHVVQQKSGRVAPTAQFKGMGLQINADVGLEQEADVMGDRAAALGGQVRRATSLRHASARGDTAQLAAPGAITHVTNSCFAAAIINIFTVTPSLKNLINPDAHAAAPLPPATEVLRDLLFRAVNTVDLTQLVPGPWVRNIMLALAGVGAIASVDSADDVNNVLGAIVPLFQANDNAAGQANHNAAAGTCLWNDGQTIGAALTAGFPGAVPPNAVWFNRVANVMAVAQAAPPNFQHVLPDGHVVTYRLTSVVQRNVDDYVDGRGRKAAHFVTYVDRSGAGNEWYQSDDVGPRVAAVPNLAAVAPAAHDEARPAASSSDSHVTGGTIAASSSQRVPDAPAPPATNGATAAIVTPSGGDPTLARPTAPDPLVSALASRRQALAHDSDSEEDDAWDDDADAAPAPTVARAAPESDLARQLAARRAALRGASDSESDEDSDSEREDARPAATKDPVASSSSHDVSGKGSDKDGGKGSDKDGAPAVGGGAFDATTGGLTYVYQRADEADLGTHGGLHTANAPGGAQGFIAEYALRVAQGQMPRLQIPAQRAAASQILRSLLFVPAVHELVASDRAAFDHMYVDIKAPAIDPRFRFSTDPKIDQAKRGQRIHAVADQLYYLLVRLGAGPRGLANDASFDRATGTELTTHLTQATAREAQASTLAKLIAHYAGEEVRLPAYAHRCGPMLGRTKQYQDNGMTMDQYHKGAADSLQAILSSQDPQGSSIRPTDAAAGFGAYISTDGDNFYGPHGFAFDPRDVHQLPLSSKSTDNNKKHSAERSSAEGHQFRATSVPIPFVEDGRSHVAEYFVGTSDEQRKDLPTTLDPTRFNPGVLPVTIESVVRDQLRGLLQLPPLPQVHASATHDQPKGAEEVTLMRDLIHELEGLYEPLEWAALWQNSQQHNLMASMMSALGTIRGGATDGGKDKAADKSAAPTPVASSSTLTGPPTARSAPGSSSDAGQGGSTSADRGATDRSSSSDDEWNT